MIDQTTYKIYTHGCKVNQYDSGQLDKMLGQAGFLKVESDAGLAVINTCAVTKTAIQKCKRTINKASRENRKARIVILGCWPAGYENERSSIKADIVWGVGKLEELAETIKTLGQPVSANKNVVNIPRPGVGKSRYFIKIQDGCESFCSYCIVPFTRGKLKSRSKSELIDEIKSAINAGYREIVLSGVHLGEYGKEKYRAYRLENLLEDLTALDGLGRIRLSSIEPGDVSDKIIDLIKRNGKICPHLHLPLQSGSDRILQAMNRPYTTDEFIKLTKKIKRHVPDIALTTDMIVGFPGEGRKEFDESLAAVKLIAFSRLHVFPFSGHEKTPAYYLGGQVPANEIYARAKKLRALGLKLQKKYNDSFLDKITKAVIEKIENNKYIGKTEYYFEIAFNKNDILRAGNNLVEDKIGCLVEVKRCL